MKKIFNIAIIFLFALILFLSAYSFVAQKRARPNGTANKIQPGNVVPSQADEKMTIKTASGDITINNLYKKPIAMLFHNGVLFQQTPNFEISYYPDDQGFIISLLNPNLQKARGEAEKTFLETLGVQKEQACLLKISLGTTADINKKAAGQNFGLSFCPNGKPLPAE